MEKYLILDANHTKPDKLVLENLATDVRNFSKRRNGQADKKAPNGHKVTEDPIDECHNLQTLSALNALNNPKDSQFEPSVFNSLDHHQLPWKQPVISWILQFYVRAAQSVVRVDTDVVMVTHLLLYFTTSLPSALYLIFYKFTWVHGLVHFVMQALNLASYTLMRHQHIHMRGILKKRFALFDGYFPYLTDPLMGHTWNSYYYHHVKHHHVEGNGPDDLSSTLRFQRDNPLHFLYYMARFYFFIWFDLPIYFFKKGKLDIVAKAAFWELSDYALIYSCYKYNSRAAICVFILPMLVLRIGMMAGNWGQHAFIDDEEPDSDYRSSITVIDSQTNRHSFNDGYHTSHHLNPLRHWREHPNSFIKGKEQYASQGALVFHNIDFVMITIKLLMKDYRHLAQCLVPMGEKQLSMTLEERMAMLKRHTRRFTEEEIKAKFK